MKIPNLDPKKLGVASVVTCLVGAVATTVSEIVSVIRHDKRRKKLYATLQIKAENMKPQDFFDIEEADEQG